MKKKLLGFVMLTLAACGGGSGDDNGGSTFGGGDRSIDGLWDATENMGQEGIDEIYYEFDKGGLLTVYDYAGDSYDQEGNCYWIFSSSMKSLGKNKYEITPLFEEGESFVFTIARSGDNLTIEFNDPEEPSDKITIPRSTKSTSSFTPECADTGSAHLSDSVARGLKLTIKR